MTNIRIVTKFPFRIYKQLLTTEVAYVLDFRYTIDDIGNKDIDIIYAPIADHWFSIGDLV